MKQTVLKPQDVALLLLIIAQGKEPWRAKDLADLSGISQAEVSLSLSRSQTSRLLANDKRTVHTVSFLDFIKYGVPYAYPAVLGPTTRGVSTAFIDEIYVTELAPSSQIWVWADPNGNTQGVSIAPLFPTLPQNAPKFPAFYQLLCLVDLIRIGRVREKEESLKIITQVFNKYQNEQPK